MVHPLFLHVYRQLQLLEFPPLFLLFLSFLFPPLIFLLVYDSALLFVFPTFPFLLRSFLLLSIW